MIISHKYKFIFIKTFKTASTSIEVYLSKICHEDDIVTPIFPHVKPHKARNYTGYFNPIPEIVFNRGRDFQWSLRNLLHKQKFYNHIPAQFVKSRVPARLWRSYFKFCVERNPWSKTLSHYYMKRHRSNNTLTLADYFEQKQFCLNYPIYTDKRGQLLVDRVVRFEDLDSSLSEIFSDLDIPFPGKLQVRAKSEYRANRDPYWKVLSAEQQDTIAEAFSKEIALHGYQRENFCAMPGRSGEPTPLICGRHRSETNQLACG